MIAYDCCGYTSPFAEEQYRSHFLTRHFALLINLEVFIIFMAALLIIGGGINNGQADAIRRLSETDGMIVMISGGITLALIIILEVSIAAHHRHHIAKREDRAAKLESQLNAAAYVYGAG